MNIGCTIKRTFKFDKRPVKIALIGLGMHAQRIYYPLFKEYAKKMNVELSLVVDLESSKNSINKFIQAQNYHPKELIYLPNKLCSPGTSYLHKDVERYLSNKIRLLEIDGAIVATEPLAHKMYANFCFEHNLHILMDKPITTQTNCVSNIQSATRIYEDFEDLKQEYDNALARNNRLTFSITAQRRFHPAYLKIKELIDEVSRRVNIPITSIHSYHSDGEWRMPFDIADQSYHSYNEGYGKISHSGYHSIDVMSWLVQSSYQNCRNKDFDRLIVSSKLIRPLDVLAQFTCDDLRRLFGEEEYNKHNSYQGRDVALQQVLRSCGEIDAFTQANFKAPDGSILTTATLNLQHNGFSNRSWLSNHGRNLYKGNGRVRHESHTIQQGPFQTIHLNAFQSKFDPDETDSSRYEVGGVDHLDVIVCRNPLVATERVGTFEKFSIKDLGVDYMKGYSRGHQENSRALAYFDFINKISGEDKSEESKSDFLSHQLSVGVMSAAYQAHCLQNEVSIYKNADRNFVLIDPNEKRDNDIKLVKD